MGTTNIEQLNAKIQVLLAEKDTLVAERKKNKEELISYHKAEANINKKTKRINTLNAMISLTRIKISDIKKKKTNGGMRE